MNNTAGMSGLDRRPILGYGIGALAAHMKLDDAASTCAAAAAILLTAARSPDIDSTARYRLAFGLSAVVDRADPDAVALMMTGLPNPVEPHSEIVVVEGLAAHAFGIRPWEWRGQAHTALMRAGVAGGPGGLFPALPLLHPPYLPQPNPLPPQQLVDLLKDPFCVAKARRVVLDALGYSYRREFADQWEFVRFAQENNLPLDLTTPPKRPRP